MGWGKSHGSLSDRQETANKRAVLVVNKRNVTRKFKTSTQLWQLNLNLAQDVANNRKKTA